MFKDTPFFVSIHEASYIYTYSSNIEEGFSNVRVESYDELEKSGGINLSDQASASRALWNYIKSRKWFYMASIAAMYVSILAQVRIPPIIGAFADAYNEGSLQPGVPTQFALYIIGWATAFVSLHWLATFIVQTLARDFEFELRNRLFSHWESLSQSYYTHESVGNLMAYATNDIQGVRSALSMGMHQILNAFFVVIITVPAMLRIVGWQFALVTLFPLPIVSIAIAILRPKIRQRFRRLQEGFATLSERTQESLSGTQVVKAYVQEEYELNKFEQAADDIVKRGYALVKVSGMIQPLIQLVAGMSFLIAIGYGAVQVIQGDLHFGNLVTYTTYLTMLTVPMRQIGNVIDSWQRASAALNRLTGLLRQRSGVRNVKHPIPLDHTMSGEIRIKNLTFRYPYASQPVLHNIDLHVRPGETVAILGRTAAGKTTLVNLLARVYEPPRDTLFIDGHDVRDVDVETLRRHIAYVPQDVFLFSATIGENIAFGVEHMDETKITHAAKQAQVYDDIDELERGFDTELGERGIGLSGGQRQRVSLARALIKQSPILVLDDSLSAVDTKTEAAILAELEKVRGQRTVIIIAHRISTVREADHIIVMDDGRIVERGTHDQLMGQRGLYREMYELQKRGTATGSASFNTKGEKHTS